MKNLLTLLFLCLSVALAGCIVDVAEQNTERLVGASGKGVISMYFDATIYRGTFDVQGSPSDTLIADGKFSLWAPGSSTASSIAQNVNMYWSIDTLHRGQLVAFSEGPQRELITIDKMSATIPAKARLKIDAGSTDISVKSMKGDLEINGTGSNIDFATDGRIGDIDITLPSVGFESLYATDTTGNVTLHIAAGAPITFHLQTSHGNINVNYDLVHQSAVGSAINTTANGGGKVITVSTDKGNITVVN
jgi:hypothetical protein